MSSRKVIATAALAAIALLPASATAQAGALRHLGHVLDGFGDTPDGVGLLVAAQAEAEIAAQHAALAASSTELARIQAHAKHVVHALDPTKETTGPGKGYGATKAATAVARHIDLAAQAEGASDGVKTHSTHVKTSAQNVLTWAGSAIEVAAKIAAATDAGRAAELAAEMKAITDAIVSGKDANGDGRISWGEGEGGLAQAARHAGLMKEAAAG